MTRIPLLIARRFLALGTFLLAASPARSEAADPSAAAGPHASAGPAESAESLRRRGADAFHEKRYEEARGSFARAYELDPNTETLLELGMAELFTDHPVEAAQHLREYVGRKDAPANKLDAVQQTWLRQAEQQTARLDIYLPAGAEVLIDGTVPTAPRAAPPGQGPLTIVIRPGEHDVVEHQGTAEEVKHVVANGGERIELHFQPLAVSPAELSPPMQWDGLSTEDTRMAHRDSSAAKWGTVIALGSVAVVATGVAVGFTAAFDHASSEAGTLSQQLGRSGCAETVSAACTQLQHDHDAEHSDASMAAIFYLGAGIAALGAVASWALWPSPERSRSRGTLHLSPTISLGRAGLSLGGAW